MCKTTLGTPSRVTGNLFVLVLLSDGLKYPKHLYGSHEQQPIFKSLESFEKLKKQGLTLQPHHTKGETVR